MGYKKRHLKYIDRGRIIFLGCVLHLIVIAFCALYIIRRSKDSLMDVEIDSDLSLDEMKTLEAFERTRSEREGKYRFHVEVVSWSPRIFILRDFLSYDECQNVIQYSRSSMSSKKTKWKDRGVWMDFPWYRERVAAATQLPVINQELGYVTSHAKGEGHRDAHVDFFKPTKHDRRLNNRIITFTTFLNHVTPKQGGQIVFPRINNLTIQPRQGDALFFYNTSPSGHLDPMTEHQTKSIIVGSQWSITTWVHQSKFGGFESDFLTKVHEHPQQPLNHS